MVWTKVVVKLSKHFELWEFEQSQTATRRGIYNKVTPNALANLKRLARRLEKIRKIADAPIIISSGYRSLKLNRAVGGSSNSQHIDGLAVDFNIPGYTVAEVIAIIKSSGIKYDQLINEFGNTGNGWVHLSIPFKGDKPRMQSFTIG